MRLSELASEAEHQRALFQWRDLSVGSHPELRALYHIPNESSERANPLMRFKFKRLGGLSGLPDIHLPVARGGFHSLYIELKKIGGRVRKEQVEVLRMLRDFGNAVTICYGHQEAEETILKYLKMKETK